MDIQICFAMRFLRRSGKVKYQKNKVLVVSEMLIKEVKEINEFRGIKQLANPLPLKKFNVLIGKNNSGKSTLLEALFLYPHPERNPPTLGKAESVLSYLSKRRLETKNLIYKYSGTAIISLMDINNSLWNIAIDENGNSNVKINGKPLLLDKEKDLLYYYSQAKETLNVLFAKEKEIPLNPKKPVKENTSKVSLYFPYDTNFIRGLDQYLIEHENPIMKYNIHTKVVKMISEQLDENFTEIVLKHGGWYLRREDASYIHIDDVGDGVKKAARIMMVVELLKPKLILWDDFDTSLHPAMIKMLLKWLAKGDWQVVIATHSIDVLYYLADLAEELEEFDAQLIALAKGADDKLNHKELTMEELEDLIEANIDPRMLAYSLKV